MQRLGRPEPSAITGLPTPWVCGSLIAWAVGHEGDKRCSEVTVPKQDTEPGPRIFCVFTGIAVQTGKERGTQLLVLHYPAAPQHGTPGTFSV